MSNLVIPPAPIITGVGTATATQPKKPSTTKAPASAASAFTPETVAHHRNLTPHAHRFNWTRNDLN